MKKQFLFAIAVTMLTACVNTDNFKEVSDPVENAIDFSTFANKQTKAENSTATDKYGLENYNTHFKVWGYKNARNAAGTDNEDTYLFGKTDETYPGTIVQYSSSAWVYSPLRFWDKSANYYRFFAASPANRTWVYTSTAGQEKIALNDFIISGANRVLTGASGNVVDKALGFSANDYDEIDSKATLSNLNGEDLMISTDITNWHTYTGTAVNLEFNHILSRLNIGVRKSKDLENYVVKLNTLEIHNLVKKASFNEGATLTTSNAGIYLNDKTGATAPQLLQNGTYARWTPAESGTRFTDNTMKYYVEEDSKVKPLEIKAVGPATGITDPDQYRYVFQGLVIPQVVNYAATVASTEDGFKMDGSNVASYSTYPYLVIDYEIWTAAEDARTYVATDPEVILDPTLLGTTKAAVDSYKIDGYKYFYNLSEAFGGSSTANTYFCEGYQNTLKITLKPTAIAFDAEVFYWANGTTHEVDIQ